MASTESAAASILERADGIGAIHAPVAARTLSAAMFLSMAAGVNIDVTVEDIIQEIGRQVRLLVRTPAEDAGQ